MKTTIEIERELAVARGWTHLMNINDVWLGTPSDGAPNSRGQAVVPQWARKWEFCGPLMVEHGLIWTVQCDMVYAGRSNGQVIAAAPTKDSSVDAAVMQAIAHAALILEAEVHTWEAALSAQLNNIFSTNAIP